MVGPNEKEVTPKGQKVVCVVVGCCLIGGTGLPRSTCVVGGSIMETEKVGAETKKGYAVGDLNLFDFFVAFTNFFGVRRSGELLGLFTFWRVAGIIRFADEETSLRLVKEAAARGISSKSGTYRALADLRRFGEHFEPLREGVPLSELIDLILSAPNHSQDWECVLQFNK